MLSLSQDREHHKNGKRDLEADSIRLSHSHHTPQPEKKHLEYSTEVVGDMQSVEQVNESPLSSPIAELQNIEDVRNSSASSISLSSPVTDGSAPSSSPSVAVSSRLLFRVHNTLCFSSVIIPSTIYTTTITVFTSVTFLNSFSFADLGDFVPGKHISLALHYLLFRSCQKGVQ